MLNKDKIKSFFLKFIRFLFNPRFIICFGVAWFITNGWSYVCFAIGTFFKINLLVAISGAYMTFLWIPFTPEKIITVIISIKLLKLLFPDDKKTLAVLKQMKKRIKEKAVKHKEKRKK